MGLHSGEQNLRVNLALGPKARCPTPSSAMQFKSSEGLTFLNPRVRTQRLQHRQEYTRFSSFVPMRIMIRFSVP